MKCVKIPAWPRPAAQIDCSVIKQKNKDWEDCIISKNYTIIPGWCSCTWFASSNYKQSILLIVIYRGRAVANLEKHKTKPNRLRIRKPEPVPHIPTKNVQWTSNDKASRFMLKQIEIPDTEPAAPTELEPTRSADPIFISNRNHQFIASAIRNKPVHMKSESNDFLKPVYCMEVKEWKNITKQSGAQRFDYVYRQTLDMHLHFPRAPSPIAYILSGAPTFSPNAQRSA